MITRAMILAAGLGTRLRPLTEVLPKPLVPVVHRPLVGYLLHNLRAIGVTDVVMNLYHLPGAFPLVLGTGFDYGLTLHFLQEDEILGTGGGVHNAAGLLGDGPCLLLNGDFLVEVDLARVVADHEASRRLDDQVVATMVLREDPAAQRYGTLGVDSTGRIVDFVGRARVEGAEVVRRGMFTGIHVLEKALRDRIPAEGAPDINRTAYPTAITEGQVVRGYFQKGHWSDIGTLGGYLQANLDVLYGRVRMPGPDPRPSEAIFVPEGQRETLDGVEVEGPVSIALSAELEAGVKLGPGVVVGDSARLRRGTHLQRVVLLPGSQPPPIHLDGGIIYRTPGGTQILSVEPTSGDPGR